MTTAFRIVRLYALAAWVGSLFFFGFVASIAFSTMPDAHLAGIIVRNALAALHHIGLAGGLIYLFFTLALLGTQRDSHPVRAAELVLVILMLLLTAYSQFSVMPRMERDRISLGGDVAQTSPDTPARRHFDRLHRISVRVEGAVLIEGLLLLGMAAIHGRDDDFDRFN